MNALILYSATILFLCTGIVSALVLRRNNNALNYVAHSMAAAGSTTAILCAIFVFREGTLNIPLFTWGYLGTVAARVDNLAAFFVLILGLLGAAASVYAVGYCREYYGRRLCLMAAYYNAFLLTMVLVFTLSHVTAFLVAWEAMAVISFFLVNHDYEKPSTRRASYVYLVMTHVGTAFIIAAFLMLVRSVGSFDFTNFHNAVLPENTRSFVFLCALLGFGTKAGVMPIHVWLPLAHPAAPSHVSALMSGIMIKTAVYGLCRFFLEFLGAGPSWWGELVLSLAILSCVLGVLYALMEHDLKKLLAYSSVENVGIILLGVGAGLVFMSKGQSALAGLAWSAALFHTFNHALFKALLFLCSGAIVQAAHTKDFEKLGGLIKFMPLTAVAFLAGSAATSALPMFNGFISEWMTFQALFYLPFGLTGISGKVAGAAFVALLGLTGALAAMCFVKAFGITFLAKPRSDQAAQAQESNVSMTSPMLILAAVCIIIGLWPQPVLDILKIILADAGIESVSLFSYNILGLQLKVGQTVNTMTMLGVVIIFLIGLLAASLLARVRGKAHERQAETWTCGIYPNARMEYTATGFSKPVRVAFSGILRPQRHTVVSTDEGGVRHLEYHLSINYVLNDKLYRPFNESIIRLAKILRKIQSGSLQLYISYILFVTVVALIWSTR